jgi:DNA-binding MarR family transcriptional regulator
MRTAARVKRDRAPPGERHHVAGLAVMSIESGFGGVSFSTAVREKMAFVSTEEQILSYLSSRPATPEHLAGHLGISSEDLGAALGALVEKGWINTSSAWYGNDPSTGITVITLTPERREGMKAESEEPVLLTRDELVAELRKRFGLTEEQTANNPTLRDDRYYFWPSIGAWTSAQSD